MQNPGLHHLITAINYFSPNRAAQDAAYRLLVDMQRDQKSDKFMAYELAVFLMTGIDKGEWTYESRPR